MLALRYAAVIALACWAGGLVALGAVAAPAAFDVLGARGPEGRAAAGAVFGETLRRFHTIAYLCGAVVLISLVARALLGPRPGWFSLRLLIAAAMLAAAIVTGFVLIPQIEEAQRSLGGQVAALPEADPRRAAFGRLHGLSASLQLVPVVGGLTLLLFELRD
jgi:putative copper export protein